jgi:hypothetical protein
MELRIEQRAKSGKNAMSLHGIACLSRKAPAFVKHSAAVTPDSSAFAQLDLSQDEPEPSHTGEEEHRSASGFTHRYSRSLASSASGLRSPFSRVMCA